jgi:hypothetical protein
VLRARVRGQGRGPTLVRWLGERTLRIAAPQSASL